MTHWIIPSSPTIYDVAGAFGEHGVIPWHQKCNMEIGDIVYIYATAPDKEIRFKCAVEAVDIPLDPGGDEGYIIDAEFCARTYERYMELRLIEVYDNAALGYQFLLQNGLTGAVRSPRRVSPELQKYIESVT